MQGYAVLQSSTAFPLVFLMIDSADHLSGKTGLTLTVTISKNGGSFGSPSGSVTEIADGWYKVAGNATDTGTLGPLVLHATATGADPTDALYSVVAYNPQDGNLALTGLAGLTAPTAGALITSGTGTAQLSVSSGKVSLSSPPGIRKNVALAGFVFQMVLSDHATPATGKTVTCRRSIDGAAFGACTNSATEIVDVTDPGNYKIDLSAADLNGGTITLAFSEATCDTTYVTIVTQP